LAFPSLTIRHLREATDNPLAADYKASIAPAKFARHAR
jgi:hypothetical protein